MRMGSFGNFFASFILRGEGRFRGRDQGVSVEQVWPLSLHQRPLLSSTDSSSWRRKEAVEYSALGEVINYRFIFIPEINQNQYRLRFDCLIR